MISWFRHLDELLRGRRTEAHQLLERKVDIPIRSFVPIAIVLGGLYGFFMGWFGVVSRPTPQYLQVVASIIKLPALFLLTLMVTLPSLYVFSALMGSQLSFASTFRLLVGAIVVNLAVAAALGPILGFFTISTTSYSFMILLNVLLMAISGFVGLGFLLRALRKMAILRFQTEMLEGPPPSQNIDEPVKTRKTSPMLPDEIEDANIQAELIIEEQRHRRVGQPNFIFRVWLVIYSLVGAQMGWLLRPFIGSPGMEFTWFRHRHGNFFQSVVHHLHLLMSGTG